MVLLSRNSSLIPVHYLVGIDEAGRGPLAGPVAVGAVLFLEKPSRAWFPGAKDSKQLSEKKREEVRARVERYAEQGMLRYAVSFSSSTTIDREGIVPAIQGALRAVLTELQVPSSATLLLDGALRAPKAFLNQRTIIRGDETELPITLAGIMAKTERDRKMYFIDHVYPEYGFGMHKGYGTKHHYEALVQYGPCPEHRRSFLGRTDVKW